MNTSVAQSTIERSLALVARPTEYHSRYLKMGMAQFRFANGVDLKFVLGLAPTDITHLQIPLLVSYATFPPMYLSEYTSMGDIYKAIGLQTYDHALPQSFFDAYIRDNGRAPVGVWLYDNDRYGGEFYSLDQALREIGRAIVRGAAQLLFAHNPQVVIDNLPVHNWLFKDEEHTNHE